MLVIQFTKSVAALALVEMFALLKFFTKLSAALQAVLVTASR